MEISQSSLHHGLTHKVCDFPHFHENLQMELRFACLKTIQGCCVVRVLSVPQATVFVVPPPLRQLNNVLTYQGTDLMMTRPSPNLDPIYTVRVLP